MPRREVLTTVVLATATAALFILVAVHATRAPIQRIDDRFLRLMAENRSPAATDVAKFFNVLGLVYVTLPVRVAIGLFLAVRRRWWHLAAFVGAVVLSEVCTGTIKGLYDRPGPPALWSRRPGLRFHRATRWRRR